MEDPSTVVVYQLFQLGFCKRQKQLGDVWQSWRSMRRGCACIHMRVKSPPCLPGGCVCQGLDLTCGIFRAVGQAVRLSLRRDLLELPGRVLEEREPERDDAMRHRWLQGCYIH